MLSISRPNFKKIQSILLRQKKQVEEELKLVEKDDPLFDGGLAESIEPGTASWMDDVHSRVVAVKDSSQALLGKIQKALFHLKKGDYGKCENCGKMIEMARLEAMPTATLCIACSKKAAKKS